MKSSSQSPRKVNLTRSVVTAAGYEQDIKNAPASIAIVEKEEILTRPVRDIGDMVQDVPGVYIEKTRVGSSEISMRGLGSVYTLILIDGKRQNVDKDFDYTGWGGTFSSFMPPPSMIERVEVIRGPASVLYGSDAMGGVINIITKKHSDELSGGVQLDSQIMSDARFGNIFGGNAYINIPLIKNMLSLNLRGSYKAGGRNAYEKPAGLKQWRNGQIIDQDYSNPYTGSTAFTNWNVGGRLNFTPNKNNYIYLDSELYFARTGSLSGFGGGAGARDFYKLNNVLNHEANYDWGKLTSYVQYSYMLWIPHTGVPIGGKEGTLLHGNDGNGREDNLAIFQSNYFKDFSLGSAGNILFNGGVHYAYEQLRLFDPQPIGRLNMHTNQAALFAEGEYLINEYISATLGGRYNYSDKFKTTPNPRFYVNINPTEWLTLKGGVTSGVLIPAMTQLYTYTNSFDVLWVGNKDLKPEQSWNYELSAVLDFEPAMLILTGYYTDFKDQIIRTQVQGLASGGTGGSDGSCTNNFCQYYNNTAKSYMSGVELSLKVKPMYGFSLDANYGFTHTEVLKAAPGYAYQEGEAVNNIPRHTFTLTPRYAYKDFSAYLRWSGKYQTPTDAASTANAISYATSTRGLLGKYYKDYQLVDIGASYKIKQYTLTLAVNNVLDVDFWDPMLYTTYGGNNINNPVANGGYINPYQRVMPSRSYWLSVRADF